MQAKLTPIQDSIIHSATGTQSRVTSFEVLFPYFDFHRLMKIPNSTFTHEDPEAFTVHQMLDRAGQEYVVPETDYLNQAKWMLSLHHALRFARGVILNPGSDEIVRSVLLPYTMLRGILTVRDVNRSDFIDNGLTSYWLIIKDAIPKPTKAALDPGFTHIPYYTIREVNYYRRGCKSGREKGVDFVDAIGFSKDLMSAYIYPDKYHIGREDRINLRKHLLRHIIGTSFITP